MTVAERGSDDGYSDAIRYRGHSVRVRDDDGVHLNIPGQVIAAKLLAKLVRGEG
jgi:hypothetical protein